MNTAAGVNANYVKMDPDAAHHEIS